MNTDIRIALSFKGHRKRRKLKLILGPGSTDYLIDLWLNTAVNHPRGVLTDMSEIDIALEAGWEDDPNKFVDALLECRLLDRLEDGTYQLHDWQEHQPWVVGAEERSRQAAEAARAMWEKKRAKSKPKADSKRDACGAHADGNAPSPSPSPSPIPKKPISGIPKNGTPPTPEVKGFIDYAYQTFETTFHEKMNIDGKKDGAIVKRLVSTYGLDKLKGLWNVFMRSEDPFICQAGRSIGVFQTQVNKLISGSGGFNGSNNGRPSERQTLGQTQGVGYQSEYPVDLEA